MGVQSRKWRGWLTAGLTFALMGCSSSSSTGFTAGVRVDQMLVRDLDVRVGNTGALLTWISRDTSLSQVRYGTTTALAGNALGTPGTNHRVELTGLAPDTLYYFSFTGSTTVFRFKTLGGTRSRLAFVSTRVGGQPQLFFALDLGENVTQVTTAGAHDPALSRDGTRLAFVAKGASGRDNLWVAEVDTAGVVAGSLHNLTQSAGRDESHPAWSPDKSQLAFTVTGAAGSQLVLRDVAAGTETIVAAPGNLVDQPVFAPSGTRLAFTSNARSSIVKLAALPVDPGSVTAYVNDGYHSVLDPARFTLYDTSAGWVDFGGAGVGGLKVAVSYTSLGVSHKNELHTVPANYVNLFACDLDGGNLKQLTNYQRRAYDPLWLPDGSAVLHTEEWGAQTQLVQVDPLGVTRTEITPANATDHSPTLSPDGQTYLFVSNRGTYAVPGLWVLPRGGVMTPLDLCSAGDSQPVWTVIP